MWEDKQLKIASASPRNRPDSLGTFPPRVDKASFKEDSETIQTAWRKQKPAELPGI